MEIYPGFGASEVLYGRYGEVVGVATGDVGVAKDGTRKDNFARGTELRAKLTLFGEGCRGSLSEVPVPAYLLHGSLCYFKSCVITVMQGSGSYIIKCRTLGLCMPCASQRCMILFVQ